MYKGARVSRSTHDTFQKLVEQDFHFTEGGEENYSQLPYHTHLLHTDVLEEQNDTCASI